MSNEKKEKQKRGILFWFVFLLIVSVIATSLVTIKLMDKYYLDASGAIDISQNNPNAQQQPSDTEQQLNSGFEPKPGFETSSAEGVWTTNTSVDIFKSSYTNSKGQVTVKSRYGDKVIAPGTSNTFVFKLANTGNVPLDFQMNIEAKTSRGYVLPIKTRVQRYDNKWVVGDSEEWVDTTELDKALDTGTLDAGKYVYYTLEWEWPFEGTSKYDVRFGDITVNDPLCLYIDINTYAETSKNFDEALGITIPNTGDNGSLVIWGTVAACSLIIIIATIIFIILLKRREDEQETSVVEDTQIEKEKN